jgi:hypothetical protein
VGQLELNLMKQHVVELESPFFLNFYPQQDVNDAVVSNPIFTLRKIIKFFSLPILLLQEKNPDANFFCCTSYSYYCNERKFLNR